MKKHKRELGLLLIFCLVVAGLCFGKDYPIETKRGRRGIGWIIQVADDDIDASAELLTELDTAFVQMAAADNIYVVSSTTDTTQTVSVSGVTSAGKLVTEEFTLAGATPSSESSATYAYVDQTWLDIECAGTISINVHDAGATLINSVEIGSLKGDIGQHFSGEKYSYIQSWWATSTTTNSKLLELRWYPDDADCLDATTGFMLLDRIFMADSVYKSDVHTFADYPDGGIRLAPGGWIAIYGTGGTTDQEATVTVIGFDRSR